jgi:hypothetical protein
MLILSHLCAEDRKLQTVLDKLSYLFYYLTIFYLQYSVNTFIYIFLLFLVNRKALSGFDSIYKHPSNGCPSIHPIPKTNLIFI